MQFCDKQLFLFFNKLGFPIGKKGNKIKIPENINIKHYKPIIQGYFATNGCLVITNNNSTIYPRIEFSSISKGLLLQVLNYLNNNNMRGNIYISHKAKENRQTLYRIQFNGIKNLKNFRKIIGFVNPKHELKYNKWRQRYLKSRPLRFPDRV